MAKPSLSRRQRAAASAIGMVPMMVVGIICIHYHMLRAAFGLEIGTGLLYSVWVAFGKDDKASRGDSDEGESGDDRS